jgi:hypothetical protein
MRIAPSLYGVSVLALLAGACSNGVDNVTTPTVTLGNPGPLSYVLLPGSPGVPAGVLLTWVAATDPNVTNYAVYAAAVGGGWNTLAYTSTTDYFDPGTPATQYYVASEDANGDLSTGTTPITVTATQVLPPPDNVTADSINSGVELTWSPDARLSNPADFAYYRIYSEPAVVAEGTTSCPSGAAGFGLEGTSVSEGYVVTGLTNGTPWCFGVTTVAVLGQESVLSTWAIGTPSASGPTFDITKAGNITVGVHRSRQVVTRAR